MSKLEPCTPDRLRLRAREDGLSFGTTAELAPLGPSFGQKRALEALRFGVAMKADDWHLIVVGEPGLGRRTLLKTQLAEAAANEPTPEDICYVHGFDRATRPKLLRLPAGRGRALVREIGRFVADVRSLLPSALESEELRTRKQRIEEEEKRRHEGHMRELRDRAEAKGVVVIAGPMGFAIAPAKEDGVMPQEEFEQLPDAEKERLRAAMSETHDDLARMLEEVPRIQREIRTELRKLLFDTAEKVVHGLMDDLRELWAEEHAVRAHLDAMEADILENAENIIKLDGEGGVFDIKRYGVNLLVDHADTRGAPVVFEDNATYPNLVGRVEHTQQLGVLVTDFQLIRAGALHRANGGYLVLDARDLLSQPLAYEALKRALRSREIRIQSAAESLGLSGTVTLEPQPVPLHLKVVLLTEPRLFHLIDRLDADIRALFKVVVEFAEDVPRTSETTELYARLVGSFAREEGLLPLGRGAVARLVEEAARRAGDREKLSADVLTAFDLVREAAFLAQQRGAASVDAADVVAAISAQRRRSGLHQERVVELVTEGTLLVDTKGTRVGTINGLAVVEVGRSVFGRPTRITAKVRLGRGEVVDVEREVELSGPIHAKGVLIVSSFLSARYANEHPLSLQASLVFEQSYGVVDGDSASCAELCALLSELADLPLAQSLAMTGSVNQLGEVQAVGGVNEKIEGFFDVCRERGLTGEQGVIVPRANLRNLMLRDDVVEACAAGTFRVYAVSTVDEAMEILTGVEAGERSIHGAFPTGSVNARVETRLLDLARKRFDAGPARPR